MFIFLIFTVILYRQFNPLEYNCFPPCPFYTLTGWLCPGCGSQRAIHHLLNGNLINAWHDNPMMILSIPYLMLGLTFRFIPLRNIRLQRIEHYLFHGRAISIILFILILYWIGRNVL